MITMDKELTYNIMDVLGVSQLSKQYKTPAYVRKAVKNYQQRLQNKDTDNDTTYIHHGVKSENKPRLSSPVNPHANAEACKKHRVKKKLHKLASGFNLEHIRSIVQPVGVSEEEIHNSVEQIQNIICRYVDDKPLLEQYIGGSKRQTDSILHVLLYHVFREKMGSLTNASTVFGTNIKTLTNNYKAFLSMYNRSYATMYSVKLFDPDGKEVSISYIPKHDLNSLFQKLPMLRYQDT